MSRVIPGILMALCWFLLLFWGSPLLFWAAAVGGGAVALFEFFRMTCPFLTGLRLHATIVGCLLPLLVVAQGHFELLTVGLMACLLVVVAIALQGYGKMEDAWRYLSCAGFAGLYIAGALAHLVLIRFLPQGPTWLALLIAMIAGSDTGAYYAGRAFGKRRLFPRISPKKTVAGGIGGIIAGLAAVELLNLVLPYRCDPLWLLPAAATLIVIGVAGDLTESLIKRSVGVKDSGAVLFGHGGLLDRIDSLLLTGPVFFYLLHFRLLS